jgi:hypothetical protein
VLPVYSDIITTGYRYYSFQGFWEIIYDFFWNTKYVYDFTDFINFRIPVWVMMIVISANALGMKLEFDCYKKKWWYYLIILISFIMSFVIFKSRNGTFDSV